MPTLKMFAFWVFTNIVFLLSFQKCISEKIVYISTEQPAVTYFNQKYVSYLNLTARRHGRGDPFYYVDLNIYTLWPFDNNLTVHAYFFEFLTNVYKRSFVEMHFPLCDLIHKDKFFGTALKQGNLAQPCPYPSGAYNLHNMTIPVKYIPPHFPFRKGRIYCNCSITETNEVIVIGHIDMEIKETYLRKRKTVNVH